MRASAGFVASDDGTPLHRYCWSPEHAARGVVHVAHGLGEHAERYETVARHLTASGFTVYAHDHRGHGRTAENREALGWFAASGGWQRAIRDLEFLLGCEKRAHRECPLVLLGHSMGSFMAQQVLYERPELLSGCALSGSTGRPRPRVAALHWLAHLERLRLGPRGRSRILHRLSLATANKEFEPRRTDFDWLTRDVREVDRYCADPDCGFVGTVQLWLDLIHGVREINRPANRSKIPPGLPVYLFAGTADPVSDGCKGLQQLIGEYRTAGMSEVRWKFYAGGRHEMLNEINRTEVIRDLVEWLEWLVGRRA